MCACSHRFRDIRIIIWPSKSRSRSRSTIFALTPFDGKCENLQKSPPHFCASSRCLRDIKVLHFGFSHVGQDHGVQFSQWQRLMTNVKITKRFPFISALGFTVWKSKSLFCLSSKSRSRSRSSIFTLIPFASKCEIYKRLLHIFCASFNRFSVINQCNQCNQCNQSV